MKKPTILIIENSIDVTGALKSITRTAFDLRDQFDFMFIIPQHSKGRFWIEGKGFNCIYELPMREISRRFSSLLLYAPYLLINAYRLNKIVRQHGISIIHVNDLYNLLPVAIRLFGSAKPYVCHIRFLPDKFPGWLFNFWLKLHLKYAKRIIAVSNSVLKQIPEHPKLTLIYNELPVEERYPDLVNPEPNKSTYTFLYLSNFIRGKGQNYGLEAFARIHNDLPYWKLRFVGGDMGLEKNRNFRRELQHNAEKLGILEKTEWVGFTEAVELEYKKADIVLNFSESESFSITCLEALFFGRPVIATDCGGPAEIIDDGISGYLVPNRKIESMAEAMKTLATRKMNLIEMGLHGREIVKSRFSIENTSYRLLQYYKEVLI
jgi:L-malate glycosyltransferase